MVMVAGVAGEFLEREVENGRRNSCAIDGGWADINVVCGLEVDPSVRQMLWRVEAGRRIVRVAIVADGRVFK